MTATVRHFTITKGQAVTLALVITDSAGAPVDITGWTLEFNVALKENTDAQLITETAAITDAAAGEAEVVLAPADTEELDPAVYRWDVWRTNAGYERQVGKGNLTLAASVR